MTPGNFHTLDSILLCTKDYTHYSRNEITSLATSDLNKFNNTSGMLKSVPYRLQFSKIDVSPNF